MIFFALLSVALGAPLLRHSEPVKDEYIVVFKKGTPGAAVESHLSSISEKTKMLHKYNIGAFRGYAARMDQDILKSLLELSEVDYVEENGVVRTSDCVEQDGATWGIARTSSLSNDHQSIYHYCSDGGRNAFAYIIDTGIYCAHEEFGPSGRCTQGFTVETGNHNDGNGHGTHVAGTVGGIQFGMAKNVSLNAVKVLSASGSGTTAGVISGVDYASNDSRQSGKSGKSVANLSLGGGKSTAMDSAVNAAWEQGLVVVVAAGNDNANACNYSPAGASDVISVAATDDDDIRATYSNFGTCVEVFAPGTAVTSAWIGNPEAERTISGTSMASPHVAGWAAKYLSSHSTSGDELKHALINGALVDAVTNPGLLSPNYLVYGDCGTNLC